MGSHLDPWPLRHLVVTTPRLELRPEDDDGLRELVALAHDGVHPPEQMPFSTPWTDAPATELGPNMLRFFWSQRAALTPEAWTVSFLVRRHGRVVGTQSLSAVDFAVTRTVQTGSWLGVQHQGAGIGTEMRLAVLLLAFDHLGARQARSAAFADNPASLAVSAKLGYHADGTDVVARRGTPAVEHRLVVGAVDLVRPGWVPDLRGLEHCRAVLGA